MFVTNCNITIVRFATTKIAKHPLNSQRANNDTVPRKKWGKTKGVNDMITGK